MDADDTVKLREFKHNNMKVCEQIRIINDRGIYDRYKLMWVVENFSHTTIEHNGIEVENPICHIDFSIPHNTSGGLKETIINEKRQQVIEVFDEYWQSPKAV